MISKRIASRADGKSSALDALKYGSGLKIDRKTGEYLDKSHRTRIGGFGLVENGVYVNQDTAVMLEIIDLAALEMQATCDLNTKVSQENIIAHFIFSFDQNRPSEAVLRDTEDTTIAALKLHKNHFATFLHDDNGHWHLHIFASRITNDEFHRGNSLWRDRSVRDHVCREIEIRHQLKRDNGLHEIVASGQIVEIPLKERRAKREREKSGSSVSDNARKFETHVGENSFQSWCVEIRIGDRLKHSNSWRELHDAASAYNCLIKQKGAGYVICPVEGKGGIQLSALGLKNLQSKFGKFESANLGAVQENDKPVQEYRSEPSKPAMFLFEPWCAAYSSHKAVKSAVLSEFRKSNSAKRLDLRGLHKIELAEIRSTISGIERVTTISIAKMRHAVALAEFAETTRNERSAIYKKFEATTPGRTFRAYLTQQAQAGDEGALALVRQYGVDEATSISCQSEAMRFNMVASLSGFEDRPMSRLKIKHQVESNGTVVFDLGKGRIVTDSAIAKQIQLNFTAANDPIAVETSLRFAVSRFGNPLTLTGTAEFQRQAVETAVRNGLFIKFVDPTLEQYRKEFFANSFNSNTVKDKQNVEHTQKYSDQRKPSPHSRDRLHRVPELNLDSESARHQMLLQSNVPICLEQHGWTKLQGRRFGVRQPAAAGRNADKIISGSKPHSYRIATPVMATEQEQRTEAKQEIINSDSTHVQHVAFTTKEVPNPLQPNVQSRLVAAQKILKVERK